VIGSGISWAICKSAPRSRQITRQHPTTVCGTQVKKTDEPIEMLFGVGGGGADSRKLKEPCVRWGAHWHRLANTMDRIW